MIKKKDVNDATAPIIVEKKKQEPEIYNLLHGSYKGITKRNMYQYRVKYVSNLLENREFMNEYMNEEYKYKLFLDYDDNKLDIEECKKIILEHLLNKGLKIKEGMIKVCYKSDGSKKYHFVIPEYSGGVKEQKILWEGLKLKYDVSVYKKCGWFRLPNQKKPEANGKKIEEAYYIPLENAKLDDFILGKLEDFTKELPAMGKEELLDKEEEYINNYEVKYNILDYEKTRKLLLGLKIDKCEDFESWKRVCIILKRSFNEDEAFELFKIFSSRGKNYSGVNKLLKEFEGFDETKYNINYGTLVHWLKEDNERLYKDLFHTPVSNNENFNNLLIETEDTVERKQQQIQDILNNYNIDWDRLTHKTFALKVKELFDDKFLYTGGKLFYWNNYYWCEDNANIYLGKIVGSLYDYYMEAHDYYKRVVSVQEATIALKTIKQLDNIKYKEYIGKQCLEEFFIEKVEWNNNNNLIQFDNSCYDLENDKFIECNPKNYINHSIGYSYVKGNKKNMSELEEIIKSTQADEKNYKELMKFLSSCLNRFNKEEIVDFWTNTGRNGKGLLKDICLLVFGNYAGDLPSSHFTQEDKNANGGKTHLYKNKNARIVFVNELNEGECLLEEPFKKWSGNDLIVCRDNFSKAKDIVSYKGGKLVFLTNNLPNFKNNKMDVGLRQRIIVRKFPFTFCDENEYDSKNPYLKIRDNELKNKLSSDEYKNAMMELLLEYYKIYKKEGFIKTDLMKNETEKYINDVDIVGNFIKDNIIYAEGKKVKVKDLYDRFRMLDNTPLTIQIFNKRLTEKNIYEIKVIHKTNYIVDYEFKKNDDSDSE